MSETPAAPESTPVPGHTEPVAQSPSPRRPGFPLVAWSLVGLLTLALVAMSVLLGIRTNQVTSLERKLAKGQEAPSATLAPATPAGDPVNQISAEPTTGPQAAALMKLPRRIPNDPMALGQPDAKVTLVEYADYRCPYCAKWSLLVLPELKKYIDAGQLRVEFRDLPLFGEESELAAAAARAAGNEGKFWEMSNAIWNLHTGQGHPSFTKDIALKAARDIGIKDMAGFEKGLTDPKIRQGIAADTKEAMTLQIKGTPHFIVNATRIPGAIGASDFTRVIEEYLAKS